MEKLLLKCGKADWMGVTLVSISYDKHWRRKQILNITNVYYETIMSN